MTAREILVPFSHRALAEMGRDALVLILSVEAETAADRQGWEFPDDLAPTIVDSYVDAEELSGWTRDRIEQALDELGEDELSDLAFAYWQWEVK